MDIVIEQVPEVSEQPQLQRETTGRPDTIEEAQLNAALHASAEEQPDLTATQEDLLNPIEPPPKRRGRPPGSKNKPQIIEQIPPEEPIVLNEPPPEELPVPEPPKKKPAASRKPRAPKAPPPQLSTQQAPVPQTPLQIAASMLKILRLEQAERQYRKGQLYKSWVK